jgi:hypothetical protein
MDENLPPPTGEFLLYQSEDGRTRIECRFEESTLWLSQAQLAGLFQVSVPTINEHLKGIYAEGELSPERTLRSFRIVRREGSRQVARNIDHYQLEAILAVGYRVRSERGTQFRQWATARLQEYLLKGFVMDDERLKNPPGPGVPDYFDELLERIRSIRASEKRMYLKLRDIFALAADYSRMPRRPSSSSRSSRTSCTGPPPAGPPPSSSPPAPITPSPTWASPAGKVSRCVAAMSRSPRTTCRRTKSPSWIASW